MTDTGQNLKFTVIHCSITTACLHVCFAFVVFPVCLYGRVQVCTQSSEMNHQWLIVPQLPAHRRNGIFYGFCASRHTLETMALRRIAPLCRAATRAMGNPRPGQQNCVRMLLPTQPSPSSLTLCWCAHQRGYCPEKAQAWVSDIAQQVKDLVVVPEKETYLA